MANIRALRGRIKSVQNIRQITRAMEMVATTKLRRFQGKAEATRPYAEEVNSLVARLASSSAVSDQELFNYGKGDRAGVFLVTSDRGLCGAYNTNVLHKLESFLETLEEEPLFFVFGKKGVSWLKKKGYEIREVFNDPPLEKSGFHDAKKVAGRLLDGFRRGEFRQLAVVYTVFHSMVKYEPTACQLLPVDPEKIGARQEPLDYILEPGRDEILSRLIPSYVEVEVFNAMIQSLTSEYASRRVSMKNATDAAEDMKASLVRTYNRARQESITKELLDIVGGAEALR